MVLVVGVVGGVGVSVVCGDAAAVAAAAALAAAAAAAAAAAVAGGAAAATAAATAAAAAAAAAADRMEALNQLSPHTAVCSLKPLPQHTHSRNLLMLAAANRRLIASESYPVATS